MRAHRKLLAVTGAIALVVVMAPVAWYLGSPLIQRVELHEPPPVLADEPQAPARQPDPPAFATSVPSRRPDSNPSPRSTLPPAASAIRTDAPTPLALAGRFRGADDFHFGRGRARLLETAPGRYVVRFEAFSVRNGPDLYVYLSPDPKGYARDAIELGRLRATDGSFNMKIAEGTDVTAARSVVIWCKQFSVQFAVARLEP
jgi:hypothetical protein